MKRITRPLAALVASSALVVLAGLSSASAADNQAVTIDNFAFAPAEATVSVGSTVTWTNQQNVRHTTTADGGAWDSGILSVGNAFAFTFEVPGDFTYHCDIHPEMTGVVHVIANAAPAPAVVDEVAVSEPAAPSEPAAVSDPAAPSAPAAPAAVPVQPAPTPKPAPSYSYGY